MEIIESSSLNIYVMTIYDLKYTSIPFNKALNSQLKWCVCIFLLISLPHCYFPCLCLQMVLLSMLFTFCIYSLYIQHKSNYIIVLKLEVHLNEGNHTYYNFDMNFFGKQTEYKIVRNVPNVSKKLWSIASVWQCRIAWRIV